MKHFILVIGVTMLCACAAGQSRRNRHVADDDTLMAMGPVGAQLVKESRFYLTVHTGYAAALGSTFKFYPDDVTRIAVNVPAGGIASKEVTYKATTRGLGEGFRYGAGISYIVNDFINVGIDLDYFSSTIRKVRDSSYHAAGQMGGGGFSERHFEQRYTISYQTKLLTIAPNITFKAISRPKFFIYNKVGAILTFRPNSIQRETQDDKWSEGWQGYYRDSSSLSATRYEWGIRNPSFGFMGAIGAQVKIMERVRVFGELQFSHILFVIRNRVLTSLDVNGVEKAGSLTRSQRELEFHKTITDRGDASDPDRPTMTVTQRFPLTYVGLQAGLAFRF